MKLLMLMMIDLKKNKENIMANIVGMKLLKLLTISLGKCEIREISFTVTDR